VSKKFFKALVFCMKAQGALEYLLGIGGVVLVAAIVVVLVSNVSQTGVENLDGEGAFA